MYYHGEPIKLNIAITNRSSKTIRRLRIQGELVKSTPLPSLLSMDPQVFPSLLHSCSPCPSTIRCMSTLPPPFPLYSPHPLLIMLVLSYSPHPLLLALVLSYSPHPLLLPTSSSTHPCPTCPPYSPAVVSSTSLLPPSPLHHTCL